MCQREQDFYENLCVRCGNVRQQSPDEVVLELLDLWPGETVFVILAFRN